MSISEIHYNGFNAGITNKYPYTDFHEMNLDWILTNYQAIIDKVKAACRVTSTAFNDELTDLISAAFKDIGITDVKAGLADLEAPEKVFVKIHEENPACVIHVRDTGKFLKSLFCQYPGKEFP